MTPGDATTLWARAFADELARAGVREVVVAPGSRSTPLVLALASGGGVRPRVHVDERSAAFFALGVGKATGVPAAVVTTSGTATANLLPAVIEAAQSETPLLVLTADRPPRYRGQDANQAIDQVRLYGPYVKGFHEVELPSLEGPPLRALRALVGRAVATAAARPGGPVHVNLPFEKPLEPVAGSPAAEAFAAGHPLAAGGRPGGAPFVRIASGRLLPSAEEVRRLAELVRSAARPALVAGPCARPEEVGPAVAAFGVAAGVPIFADPLSGARWGMSEAAVVAAYDLFLRDAAIRGRLEPDLIVRVGASPTSAALQAWMEHHSGVRQVVIDPGDRWKDHGSLATDYLRVDPAALLSSCSQALGPGREAPGTERRAWLDAWDRAGAAAMEELERQRTGEPHEGSLLQDVAESAPPGCTLFVSNSMPVRDLDAFGAPRAEALIARGNRGASGIDGIVSTAFGVAAASTGPTVCVLGDLAFFHDQNGLLWSRESDVAVLFVLVDNDGGGIFHMLPVREHEPHFTRLFATPHGLDLRHAAELHDILFADVAPGDLSAALAHAVEEGGTRVLRVRTDRVTNERRHREVEAAVARSVRGALG